MQHSHHYLSPPYLAISCSPTSPCSLPLPDSHSPRLSLGETPPSHYSLPRDMRAARAPPSSPLPVLPLLTQPFLLFVWKPSHYSNTTPLTSPATHFVYFCFLCYFVDIFVVHELHSSCTCIVTTFHVMCVEHIVCECFL